MRKKIPYIDCDLSYLTRIPLANDDTANFAYLKNIDTDYIDNDMDFSYLDNILKTLPND